MKLSARTQLPRETSALASALARLRSERDIVDLAEGNPTRVGLTSICGASAHLACARADHYAPEPLGLPEARAAVAQYYRERGVWVDPGRVVLGASTSELYGWIFKLVADPGDDVLVPRPSYPLLDWLAILEGVDLSAVSTSGSEGFRLDPEDVERAIGPRTRAIVVVHPNNPTGRFVRTGDARALCEIAKRRGVALVVDEVFGDWAHPEADPRRLPTFAGERDAPCFVLSGLSKVACLPQLKLGWLVVGGTDAFAEEVIGRLELVADSYLSVSTPVQVALPRILAQRHSIQRELMGRLATNLAALDRAIERAGPEVPVRRKRVEGGWYAMLEVARTRTDEEWVVHIASEARVIVQPGFFFDTEEGLLVVSLLPEPERFAAAIGRVVTLLALA